MMIYGTAWWYISGKDGSWRQEEIPFRTPYDYCGITSIILNTKPEITANEKIKLTDVEISGTEGPGYTLSQLMRDIPEAMYFIGGKYNLFGWEPILSDGVMRSFIHAMAEREAKKEEALQELIERDKENGLL